MPREGAVDLINKTPERLIVVAVPVKGQEVIVEKVGQDAAVPAVAASEPRAALREQRVCIGESIDALVKDRPGQHVAVKRRV